MSEDLDDIIKLLEKKNQEKGEVFENTYVEENQLQDTANGDVIEGVINIEVESNDIAKGEQAMEEVAINEEKVEVDNTKDIEEVVENKSIPAKRGRKPKQKKEDDIELDPDAVQNKPASYYLIDGYYFQEVELGIVKLRPDVILPEYKHLGDACMDLRANNIKWIKNEMGVKLKVPEDFESVTIYQGYTVKFGTGIKVKLPEGWAADVKIRSGVSSEEAIILLNGEGKIDCPYTGEWCFCIGKINKSPFTINKNDRLMQFEPRPQIKMRLKEIDCIEVDENNQRGEGGFGYSGLQ